MSYHPVLIVAGLLFFTTAGMTQSAPPALTIALMGTNQLSITITNGVGARNYEVWQTPVLSDLVNNPWTKAAAGVAGQTNFIVKIGGNQTGFFRVLRIDAVGASTPFISYEAEAGAVGGGASVVSATLPPVDKYGTPALESSGHAYVQLTANGHYVEFVNNTGQNINALNLRSCIPDSADGGGIDSTIDMYVNGVFRQALFVTSKHSWVYEGTSYGSKSDKDPTHGKPYVFWDDEHVFIIGAAVAPGDTIRLQKDAANSAAFYYIDVVDVENVPPPLTQPANSLSIMSYGAVSNNPAIDNTGAITSCFQASVAQGKTVWIPAGTFYIAPTNHGINNITGVSVRGAGPWYSTIYRVAPPSTNSSVGGIFNDSTLSLQGICLDTASFVQNGFAFHTYGTNWVVDNVWIQHVDTAVWCGGVNGIVKNCRILSVTGDGGNFNNVTRNTAQAAQDAIGLTYSNNFVRGTGDDCMAINSVNYNVNGGVTNYHPIMMNTTYANNTAGCVWKGHVMGIYGGSNSVVKDNLLHDAGRSRGLAVSRFGANGSGLLSATVTGNVIVRCGGNVFDQQQEAMLVGSNPAVDSGDVVANAYCASNTIQDSLYDAVGFSSCTNMVFQRNAIINPGQNGIQVGPPSIGASAKGIAIINSNTVTGLPVGRFALTNSASSFATIIPIQAANFSGSTNVSTETCSESGLDVSSIQNGSYLSYNSINLNGVNRFVTRAASAASGGNIEVRLDSPTGTLLGTCTVLGTGGNQNWVDRYCTLSGASGTHTVYLVFTGGNGGTFMNLQFFGLFTQPAVPQ